MIVADEQREVLAEESGEERERQEERRDPAELLHGQVHLVADGRLVQVGRARGEVAVVVELLRDADQVVVDVAEVALVLLGHPGQLVAAGDDRREHVAHRIDDLAQLHELPLHRDRLLQRGRLRVGEDRVLELVELLVELGQLREEAVHELVDDEVEDAEPFLVFLQVPVRLVPEVLEDRALALVHGDQPLRRVEAVHLDRREPGAAGRDRRWRRRRRAA